jgi:hypothetical protein
MNTRAEEGFDEILIIIFVLLGEWAKPGVGVVHREDGVGSHVDDFVG